ncbi:tubulin polyglutamylase TTLL4 isoform X2 [Callorhinchus milii]|uniref:tubulin polyglutamylase TTLL4 isoform X2 n=1 Tax=Callorhinchus milii TaxID=7868 RepID=UPI0004576078|nr:tubulin polyglutamylase TTLL4 isoform X2 [Callorhinchus milii]|eukprot:gi/632985209/ref/XP_007909551.1/ PREDICTED: tubulin polyglutamylase TTLL4 isoform X2 [Callorhinchus milii]
MASPRPEECSTEPSVKQHYKACSLPTTSKPLHYQPQETRPGYSVTQHPLWEWDSYNVIVPVRKQYTCSGTTQYVACHPNFSLPGNSGRTLTQSAHNGFHSNVLISPFEKATFYDRAGYGCRSYQRLESLSSRFGSLGRRTSSPPSGYTGASAHSFPSRALSCENLMKPDGGVTSFSQHFGPTGSRNEFLLLGKNSSTLPNKPTSLTRRPALNTNAFMRPTSAKVPLHGKWDVKTTAANGSSNENGEPDSPGRYIVGSPRNPSGSAVYNSTALKIERALFQNEHSAGNLKSAIKLKTNGGGGPEIKFTEAIRKLSDYRLQKNSAHERCVTFSKGTENVSSQNAYFQTISLGAAGKMKRALPNFFQEKASSPFISKPEKIFPGGNLEHLAKEIKESSIGDSSQSRLSILASTLHVSSNSRPGYMERTCPLQRLDQTKKLIPVSSPKTNVASITLQIAAMQLKCAKRNEKQIEKPKCNADLPESDAEVNDTEEELADGLEGSSGQECDDDSDSSSATDSSTASVGALAKSQLHTRSPELAEDGSASDARLQVLENKVQIVRPALVPSLFANMPLTVYFGTTNEKIELLPWEQKKLLKWKMSTVTPIVVRNAIARSHFRTTRKNHDWLGCWGHHMKSPAFKTLREYQKLNHFPGSFQIGRKDRLWRNLSKMQTRFGKKEFNFFPQSFVLPHDIKLLKGAWAESSKQKWIVKPPASARGIGIQVIHRWSQLPKKRPLLVQRYLHKPYLIGESKFDLRIYVYVTSYDPLRIYVFTDGLVRFASCKYSASMKSLSNKFMHLTNYSVNKLNTEYKPNGDETVCQGHKWALKALWAYLGQKGVNTDALWAQIKDVIVKTIIASEAYVNSQLNMYVRNRYSCHELFGFDVMLDENLKPWVLEVNISPSLHSNSMLDINIKGQMISDLLNLAGFVLPNKEEVTANSKGSNSNSGGSITRAISSNLELSADEKLKRVYFLSQKPSNLEFSASLLEILTPDDVRMLVETEDENNRRGHFERIFPSVDSSRYLRFFEQTRYFNILLDQWEQKYGVHRKPGIELLRELTHKRVHQGVSVSPTHIWRPPRLLQNQRMEISLNSLYKIHNSLLSSGAIIASRKGLKGKDCDGDGVTLVDGLPLPTCEIGFPINQPTNKPTNI